MKDAEIDDLISFVTSSRYARYLTYRELALHLDLGYSQWAIRSALLSRGYRRYVARRKPPLSPENKQKRLLWAQEYLSWSPSQWEAILWSDEIWVNPGHHTRTWVTRRKDEVFHEDCTIERRPHKIGWMFWGSFHGTTKGPMVFWEKQWEYSHQHPYLQLVQDGAPGYGAQSTIQELEKGGVHMVRWPPFSPDLNLIEMVWNWMKNYLQVNLGLGAHLKEPGPNRTAPQDGAVQFQLLRTAGRFHDFRNRTALNAVRTSGSTNSTNREIL
ncbi:conserved hypothetical protein [Talaromyces stipitatus ATCC 10500]|uniref:Transposable element tc3 transposase n=1 Tax=Talaromyces stipitatus (strain ATCC 10500 / CBS 375.48 / QM 6759 / NRRL 1006) TaxID=441959 RepID=B8MV64_TALSN|nr:uncharacterized protein TSTA_008160 [Talaromyces stipitatus ATCC 10500]EED11520.1 conserved hypothetical protein [Talaromyces stipitatus ATCC 10500]